LLFVALLIPILTKKDKMERITYHDAVFCEDRIDLDFYFLERMGLKSNSTEGKNVGTSENVNSSRCLKSEQELAGEVKPTNNDILVLGVNRVESENKVNDIVLNNQFVNSQDERSKDNDTQSNKTNTVYKYITYHDYLKIPKSKLFTYDLRPTNKFISDELSQHHSVIKLILKDSLVEPRFISYLKLVYRLNLIFAINAFALTDNLIEKRASNPDRVTIYIILE
jgi:hypothetical protein